MMARLGDILTISASKQVNNDEKKWLLNLDMVEQQTGNILAYNYVSENELNGSIIAFDSGNVLYSKLRPNLNKVVLPCCSGYATSEMLPLRPNADVLTREYLTAYLRSDSFVNWAVSKTAGAKMPRLGTNELLNKEMPLPSLSEQCRITSILDKLNELIFLRKQQLAKLDELVKARFVEMFGDESKFEAIPLKENVEEMFIGPFGCSLKNDDFVLKEDGFCMVYEQKHAIQKTMNVKTRYVNEQKYIELKRFTVQGGDIIVSCRGTIGEIYAVPDDAPLGIMHPSIMKIRLSELAYNKNYFVFALKQYMRKHNDNANGSGVKMAVTATTLGQEMFIVPPIHLQKIFSNFVEEIGRQKLTIQQSLDKLEMLKKSLMQKYFG